MPTSENTLILYNDIEGNICFADEKSNCKEFLDNSTNKYHVSSISEEKHIRISYKFGKTFFNL